MPVMIGGKQKSLYQLAQESGLSIGTIKYRLTHGVPPERAVINRPIVLYTVFDNQKDLPVIIDGTAKECSAAMGIKLVTFYSIASRGPGTNKRWDVIRTERDDIPLSEE